MFARGALAVVVLLCGADAAAEAGAGARCAPAVPACDIAIAAAGGRVSIEVDAAPLGDVLRHLGATIGLVVESDAALPETLSLRLHDVAIAEAVARLLRNHSYLLSQSRPDPATAAASLGRLRIFTNQPGPLVRIADVRRGSETDGVDDMPDAGDRTDIDDAALAGAEALDADAGDSADADVIAAVDDIAERHRVDPHAQVGALGSIVAESQNEALREEAVYALGRIATRASIDALTQALADPSERVREAAVYAIAELGARPAQPLLELALADASENVREAARAEIDALRRRHRR